MSNQPRLLRQEPGGHLFVWTDALAKRKDMIEVVPAPVVPDSVASGAPTADLVLGLVDKEALEAFGREHGIELDRRKSVKSMQADLIERMGLS